jgi:hypothetical protein
MDTQAKGEHRRKMYISATAVFKSGGSQPNHNYEGKHKSLQALSTPKCDQAEKKQILKECSVVPPVLLYHG